MGFGDLFEEAPGELWDRRFSILREEDVRRAADATLPPLTSQDVQAIVQRALVYTFETRHFTYWCTSYREGKILFEELSKMHHCGALSLQYIQTKRQWCIIQEFYVVRSEERNSEEGRPHA